MRQRNFWFHKIREISSLLASWEKLFSVWVIFILSKKEISYGIFSPREYYAVYIGSYLPTFRDNLSVPFKDQATQEEIEPTDYP